MEGTFDLYRDIAERTDGDVYIGVVGPVRTGKSTLISRMMEKLVLDNMDDSPRRERIADELPQSGSGRTIMTTQPKFVPGEAVSISLDDQATVRVRMVDSVGYLVEGALGTEENGQSRMVHTPWFDHDIPFEQAAEIGTRKVIAEHATIGLVVTTDGSVAELPREAYAAAEERVVRELRELGKPFVVVLNSRTPEAKETQALSKRLGERYGVPVMALNAREMELSDILDVFEQVLFQFPLREIRLHVPIWLHALDENHWLVRHVLDGVRTGAEKVNRMQDHAQFAQAFAQSPYTDGLMGDGIDLGQAFACLLRFLFLLCHFFFIPELLFFHQKLHIPGAAVFGEPGLPADILQHHLGDLIQGDIVRCTFFLAVAHIPPTLVLAAVRLGLSMPHAEG